MKNLLFVLLLCVTLSAYAQEPLKFSGNFSNQPVQEVLQKIESDLSLYFYYSPQWLDSLAFSGVFNEAPVAEVLDKVFEGTDLFYYRAQTKVYLTKGIDIIQTPEIVGDLKIDSVVVSEKQPVEVEEDTGKGLIFTREYREKAVVENDLENYVFEIGDRTAFKPGENSTIAGFIRDNETNEAIKDALIYTSTEGNSTVSTVSSADGFYSLSLPNGQNELQVQFTGKKRAKRKIVLFSDGKLDIGMDVDVIALNEVIVSAAREKSLENPIMGIEKLSIRDAKVVPVVLGERDILKVATTFAGVQTVGEGAAGFNVRGGKSDQNLFLLDGVTVYNAAHFMGFFSVFNSDALEGLEIHKSSIPTKYGGRLSSIFEVTSKKGSKEKLSGEGGISPIAARLTVEVPVVQDKASLLVSGRTTYSDWVLNSVKNVDFRENKVSFSDLILRYDHDLSGKDNLSLSGYASQDDFRLNSDTLFSFSDFAHVNTLASAKWTHVFNGSFDGSISGTYSKYGYEFESTQSPPNAFLQDFDIEEIGAKADFNYGLRDRHEFNFGVETKRYKINPGSKMPLGPESIIAPNILDEEQGRESAFYFSDQFTVSPTFSVSAGIRYSIYSALGPGSSFLYQESLPKNSDSRIGTIDYAKGDVIKTYQGAESRVSASYLLGESSSVKASYSRTRQYIHALSNTASISPTDIWRLSNEHIRPQIADQFSLGYYRDFFDGSLETSIEVYTKKLQDLQDFKTGADFLLNNTIESIALQGPGKSYGVELSIKKSGRLNGWFNYTYARTFIKLSGQTAEETINGGEFFPTNYDKPHTINLVSNYDVTKRFSVSYNLSYSTGRPVTVPVGSYVIQGLELVNYSDRNSFRIPDYVRMDLGFTLKEGHRNTKLSHAFWSFSIYNLLGRDNPFSIFFDLKDGKVKGYKLSVFGSAIPTISYNFKF